MSVNYHGICTIIFVGLKCSSNPVDAAATPTVAIVDAAAAHSVDATVSAPVAIANAPTVSAAFTAMPTGFAA